MSRFRTARTAFRESAGNYVDGKWVAGSRSVITTLASIQPIVMGQDMQALPVGRHSSDYIKVYSSDKLQITADGTGIQPDIIIFFDFGYEIVSSFANQSNIINHYKYIAVKTVQFTSNADWLNGTTKRVLNVI
jgi:hypothetical protein